MDIVVCIKRVPATDTAIKIAPDGKSIETSGVSFEMNAYDEFALEQALSIKEQLGAGTVTAITIGPKLAQKEMRDALARNFRPVRNVIFYLRTKVAYWMTAGRRLT